MPLFYETEASVLITIGTILTMHFIFIISLLARNRIYLIFI